MGVCRRYTLAYRVCSGLRCVSIRIRQTFVQCLRSNAPKRPNRSIYMRDDRSSLALQLCKRMSPTMNLEGRKMLSVWTAWNLKRTTPESGRTHFPHDTTLENLRCGQKSRHFTAGPRRPPSKDFASFAPEPRRAPWRGLRIVL